VFNDDAAARMGEIGRPAVFHRRVSVYPPHAAHYAALMRLRGLTHERIVAASLPAPGIRPGRPPRRG